MQWLLAVPHLVVANTLSSLRGILTLISAITVMFTGRIPRPLFDAITMTYRYEWRALSYVVFFQKDYPPFDFTPASQDDGHHPHATLTIAYPGELNRWKPLYKWFLAIPLAAPAGVARLAAEAEEAGWHGFFTWDHMWWRAPVRDVADPWITLAATAAATERLRLGPMVTPLARRRPAKVARETATLDGLCEGRLILGVGLGSDGFGRELSATGEERNDRTRGQMLDESLAILAAAWSGEPDHHRGAHYTVDGIRFLPDRCSDQVSPFGSQGSPEASNHCAEPPATMASSRSTSRTRTNSRRSSIPSANLRAPAKPNDIAVGLPLGTDPQPYAEAGATWWLLEFDPEARSLDTVRGVLCDGPVHHESARLLRHRAAPAQQAPPRRGRCSPWRPSAGRRLRHRTDHAPGSPSRRQRKRPRRGRLGP